MADPINLNKARKARAKAAAETTAVSNRAAFGRSKADRTAQAAAKDKATRDLDGAKRD